MPSYCRIVTWYGTMLCVEASSGSLVHVGNLTARVGYRVLLASAPNNASDVGFLSAQSVPPMRIGLGPRDYRSVVLPIKLSRRGDSRAVLIHPVTRRFLRAVPPNAPDEAGALVVDGSGIGEGETFELAAVHEALVAPGTKTIAVALEQLFAQPLGHHPILDFIARAGTPEAESALNAVWPLLTLAELEMLAKTLLGNRALLTRLAVLLRDDIWAGWGLPALAEWVGQRERTSQHPRKLQLAPALDFLAEAGFYGSFASFGHACNAYARASIKPRRDVCIIATARSEGIYVLEWLAYHRALGIQAFFLYSNDNADGSDGLLLALADAGVITWIDNQLGAGGYAQPKAYAHAFGVLPDVLDYRWALVIDLDEFFTFNPDMFSSIQDFLRWHELRAVDAIALNWVLVGSGGEGRWRDAPVTQRFRHLPPKRDRHVKTMCRPGRFIHSWPHFPVTDDRRSFVYRHATGDPHLFRNPPTDLDHAPAFSDEPNVDYASIYHYFYKSAEEFLWKFSRNRGDSANAPGISNDVLEIGLILEFMQQHESADFVLDSLMEHRAANLDTELAKLLSLPKVAEANALVRQNFRSRMHEVREACRSSPAILATQELGRRFLEIAGQVDT